MIASFDQSLNFIKINNSNWLFGQSIVKSWTDYILAWFGLRNMNPTTNFNISTYDSNLNLLKSNSFGWNNNDELSSILIDWDKLVAVWSSNSDLSSIFTWWGVNSSLDFVITKIEERWDTYPPVIILPLWWPTQMFLITDEKALCKYDTSNIAYADMASTFTATNTTNHSVSFADAWWYTKYVKCSDEGGNIVAWSVTYAP